MKLAALVIVLLITGCITEQIHKDNISLKNTTVDNKNLQTTSIGYIGCSNTIQTVQGYHFVSDNKMWQPEMDYDAGAVSNWMENAEPGNRFWDAFDRNLKETPDTKIVWWELCIRKEESTTYQEAVSVLKAIRKRIPDVTIYVSGLPPYTDGICEITGISGIKRAADLIKELDSKNDDVFLGPVLGPMTPSDTSEDGCHISNEGKEKLGKQMTEFFGGRLVKRTDIKDEDKLDETETEEFSLEEKTWNNRIEAAMQPVLCENISKVEYPISYYQGPLIDTHLHIPAIPDWSLEDEREDKKSPEGRFGGPQALLGWNIRMSEIACTLKNEGTMKNFAFFPVYEEIPKQLLEIANQTMSVYPEQFTPFIMTPGPHDVKPTADADILEKMLKWNPQLFKGYGEIGLYKINGVRDDYPPDSGIFKEIYPIVKKHNLVVYFHPGEGHKNNFENTLKEHPEIIFIVHGDQIQNDIIDLMDKYPNIYYGVDAFWGQDIDLFRLFVGKNKENYIEKMEKEFDEVLEYEVKKWKPIIEKHPNRFLWGTDRGDAVWNYDLEVGQSMVKFTRAFIGRLDPEVQEKFAYKNAEELIN